MGARRPAGRPRWLRSTSRRPELAQEPRSVFIRVAKLIGTKRNWFNWGLWDVPTYVLIGDGGDTGHRSPADDVAVAGGAGPCPRERAGGGRRLGWPDTDRLDALTALEELKGAAGAAQARVTVSFDVSHRAADADDPVPVHARPGDGTPEGERCPSRRRDGRGVAEMVALARRESPTRGDQHLGLAKALVHEMPMLHGLLTRGVVSEWVATKVVQGTAALSREDRGIADGRLATVLPSWVPRGRRRRPDGSQPSWTPPAWSSGWRRRPGRGGSRSGRRPTGWLT